ncbi:MAG: hypothetical protein ACK4UJ_11285 [Leptonema sp. (in: bacteria)]
MRCFLKIIFLIIVLLFFSFCKSGSLILQNPSGVDVNIVLVDHKIQFQVPSNWKTYYSAKRYFHFIAKSEDNIYGPQLEYRGLQNTSKTKEERNLYANGWYKAIEINFPKWKFLKKDYEEIPYNEIVIYSYDFLGEFFDGNKKIKKLGYLKFIEDRIHAIYYTAEESEFDVNLPSFLKINKKIIYNISAKPY